MKKYKPKSRKGFTIIEMIIVISIMAIIGAIAVPSFIGVKKSVAIKADKESCDTIERIVRLVIADKNPEEIEDNYSITFSDGVPKVGDGEDDTIEKEINDCISGISKPQEDGKTSFDIKIEDNYDITVTTEWLNWFLIYSIILGWMVYVVEYLFIVKNVYGFN